MDQSNKRYKFLLRNLVLKVEDKKILQKTNLKRLYIKKLSQNLVDFSCAPNKWNKRPYFHKKILKCLSQIKLCDFTRYYWLEYIKTMKSLSHLQIDSDDRTTNLHIVPKYLKRVPKLLRNLDVILQIDQYVPGKNAYQIVKGITSFKNLRSFKQSFFWEIDQDQGPEIIHTMITNYIKRLPQSKEFYYKQSLGNQLYLEKLMIQGVRNEYLTDLVLPIFGDLFSGFTLLEDLLEEEHSENDIIEENNMIEDHNEFETEFVAESASIKEQQVFTKGQRNLMRNELLPVFQFNLLPNLTKLDLTLSQCLYSLDAFTVESFACLRNLNSFSLNIEERPLNSKFLFLGFLSLPKLQSFSLKIPFIRKEEWHYLAEFLRYQIDLVSFSLHITKARGNSTRKREQSHNLEKMLICLKKNLKLRYLSLNSEDFFFENIVRGLDAISKTHQLNSLEIEGHSDNFASSEQISKSLEKFNSFLKHNKGSLYYLTLRIPFLQDVKMVNKLGEALAGLKELRELKVYVNYARNYAIKDFIQGLETIQQKEPKEDKDEESQLVDPHLVQMTRGLKKLETFGIFIGNLYGNKEALKKWIFDLFKLSSYLKKIKNFDFSIPFEELSRNNLHQIKLYLERLKNAFHITNNTYFSISKSSEEREISKLVDNLNTTNSLRCDLMF